MAEVNPSPLLLSLVAIVSDAVARVLQVEPKVSKVLADEVTMKFSVQ